MRPKLLIVCLFLLIPLIASATTKQRKEKMIEQSIESYDGNCPCPYSKDAAGRKCGERSAWYKQGGKEVLCYEKDIKANMIKGNH